MIRGKGLALWYLARLVILTAVIVIIIGVVWQFRDRIVRVCLFPPCEEKRECDVKPVAITEQLLDEFVIEKYCRLCWEKNRFGECKQDSICYVINLDTQSNPSLLTVPLDFCFIKCDREVYSIFVEYNSIGKRVEIKC